MVAPTEMGDVRLEVGMAERKLHRLFVWSEKSIKLISCELLGKEWPRNTHTDSLVMMLAFFPQQERDCKLLPRGKVRGQKSKEKKSKDFFFVCDIVNTFTLWKYQHKIYMLIHMLSVSPPPSLNFSPTLRDKHKAVDSRTTVERS